MGSAIGGACVRLTDDDRTSSVFGIQIPVHTHSHTLARYRRKWERIDWKCLQIYRIYASATAEIYGRDFHRPEAKNNARTYRREHLRKLIINSKLFHFGVLRSPRTTHPVVVAVVKSNDTRVRPTGENFVSWYVSISFFIHTKYIDGVLFTI